MNVFASVQPLLVLWLCTLVSCCHANQQVSSRQATPSSCNRVIVVNPSQETLLASLYNNIGVQYVCQGELPLAKQYYAQALQLQQIIFPSQHPALGLIYNNLGTLYCMQGDYGAGSLFYESAAQILEDSVGPDHLDTATIRANLGSAYYACNDAVQSVDNCLKAYNVRKKLLGADHPATQALLPCITLPE